MSTITMVGAGRVGTSLATRLSELGHRLTFVVREPTSATASAARSAVPTAEVRPLHDPGDGADVTVLAVPFGAVPGAVTALGPALDATVLVDATNPIGAVLPPGAATGLDVIAATRSDLTLVKAFNTIGAEAFVDPVIDGRPAFLPVAGDAGGVDAVVALAAAMGFDALAIGGRPEAVHLENLARLWIHLAFGVGAGRDFGFARVRR